MAVSAEYNAEAIEVLTGLDPVRKRPGMYTDTTRPNHLAQEVIDNSVDEALAGFARSIDVVLHADGSLSVADDGRGMPVDMHPEQGKPGVEVILCTLHAGGKFSEGSYQFSGGLHGVGVSVVNALSLQLEVTVKRDGNVYRMRFANGNKASELEIIDIGGQAQHRHHGALPARSALFRHREVLGLAPHAPAARQGRAVSGPQHHVHRRGDGPARGVVLRERAAGLHPRRHRRVPDAAGRALRRQLQRQDRGRGLGGAVAARGRRTDHRELREPDPDLAGRHARQRAAHGLARGPARVLRVQEPAAARHQAQPRGPVGALCLRAVGQAARAAVQRPDQGAPVLARGRRVHRRGRARRVLAVARTAHRGRRQARRDGDLGRRGAAAQEPPGRAQEDHLGTGAAGQARRLHRRRISTAPSCSWSRATPRAARPSRRATACSRRSCRSRARS